MGNVLQINYWNGNAEKYLHDSLKSSSNGTASPHETWRSHSHSQSIYGRKTNQLKYQVKRKIELITYCVICTRRNISRCDNNIRWHRPKEKGKKLKEALSITEQVKLRGKRIVKLGRKTHTLHTDTNEGERYNGAGSMVRLVKCNIFDVNKVSTKQMHEKKKI